MVAGTIKKGLIADGEVDTRSIEDIAPSDLHGFTQCHFFAGIGVWSYALRRAGWPDDRPVWTGSCPCQPFSSAGKGKGFADERHLWPAFYWLIRQRRPDVIFGEQVASKDGLAWIDLVHSDLEGESYAVGAVDSCAAGFGAPHIRQRMYWVADSAGQGHERRRSARPTRQRDEGTPSQRGCQACGLADSELLRCNTWDAGNTGAAEGPRSACRDEHAGRGCVGGPSPTDGFWRDADWLLCRDGKWRPVKPGTFPLAHGITNRVGQLRGAGNAIVAWQAKAFIEAVMAVLS